MPKVRAEHSVNYEELGKQIENIYLTGYLNKREMLKMSFIKGMVTGFGGVVGATIVVALLVWFLSLFDTVPLLGPFVQNINETVRVEK